MLGSDLQSYEAAEAADAWTPDAVFLSHAHLDHVGYIPYLGDIPIYCSPETETVLECLADIGNLAGFDAELLEMEPRTLDEYSGGYFPGHPKLTRSDTVPRTIRTMEGGDRHAIGSVELEVFSVGHSIPGSQAAVIRTPDQQIVYTGDLRFHGRSGHDLGDALAGLCPDVLLCEGTSITESEADDEQRVEDDMTAAIDQHVKYQE